ncbi:MAG TPA: Rieske (2Fe-2S) protein [Planctomycetaceae bacterium]|nr:Rieske (2Fe-2S) protein [Planctomycetaceae bacterium]
MERRALLSQWLVTGGSLALAGISAVPSFIAAISPALRGRSDHGWQPLGRLDDFPEGAVVRAEVEVPRPDASRALREKGVYVWRASPDETVVYSRNCTDLSCPVTFDEGSECFFCPCHGGIFARNGERLAGPPNRPLDRYATRVKDGVLEIDLNSLPAFT